MRHLIPLSISALILAVGISAIARKPTGAQAPFPPAYVPSGEQTYVQFCAACHGLDARGYGPAAYALKMPPPDLTTLAKRHEGKFPYAYVSSVLLFGPGVTAHGSSDMPTWGPTFLILDKYDERVVKQRIHNLCDYLASLQDQSAIRGEPTGR